jgi:hypothetical protein
MEGPPKEGRFQASPEPGTAVLRTDGVDLGHAWATGICLH